MTELFEQKHYTMTSLAPDFLSFFSSNIRYFHFRAFCLYLQVILTILWFNQNPEGNKCGSFPVVHTHYYKPFHSSGSLHRFLALSGVLIKEINRSNTFFAFME